MKELLVLLCGLILTGLSYLAYNDPKAFRKMTKIGRKAGFFIGAAFSGWCFGEQNAINYVSSIAIKNKDAVPIAEAMSNYFAIPGIYAIGLGLFIVYIFFLDCLHLISPKVEARLKQDDSSTAL